MAFICSAGRGDVFRILDAVLFCGILRDFYFFLLSVSVVYKKMETLPCLCWESGSVCSCGDAILENVVKTYVFGISWRCGEGQRVSVRKIVQLDKIWI